MSKTSMLKALVLGVTVIASGCGSSKQVENAFDPPSLMRLNMIKDGGHAAVACRVASIPETLPTGNLVELARTESSLLLEVPKKDIGDLGKLPGLERASVWGTTQAVARLDGRTKETLLAAWDRGDTRPVPLLVRFMDGVPDIQAKLEAQGLVPRTVAGPVVTLEADPDQILRLLEIPELMSVSLPRPLQPLGG